MRKTSLIILLFLLISALLGACKPDFSTTNEPETPAESETGQSDVESGNNQVSETSVNPMVSEPVEKDDIIVSMVELEEGQYVSKITLLVTPELMSTDIFVNDSLANALIEKNMANNSINFTMVSGLNAKDIKLDFKLGSEAVANCVITVDQTIIPSGDCGW